MAKGWYEHRTVLQIMPAGGWQAVYSRNGRADLEPLLAWAVVRVDQYPGGVRAGSQEPEETWQVVEGVVATGTEGTGSPQEMASFVCYVPAEYDASDPEWEWVQEEAAQKKRP